MSLARWTSAQAAVLAIAIEGLACGGAGSSQSTPRTASTWPQGVAPSAPKAGEPTASAAGPSAEAGAEAGFPVPPGEPARVEMKAPVTTVLGPQLQALGLDPRNLPAIEKLEPKALRGVMKLVAQSLGVKCGRCHEESDFAATTRRTRIATRMWDEFVVKLAMADGAPLFCDSCHQGSVRQLDRHDAGALSTWMDGNFVAKLSRKDGATQTCETCHVDMNMRLLSEWAR